MIPILICVPFWQGDKAQAIDVLRITAGLQQNHVGNEANIMIVARQDAQIDQNMINIISPKFNIFTYQSPSPLKGWPAGPNGMFGSTMIRIANNPNPQYECVFWMEPDCVPTRPNWFWDLVVEWRKRHPTVRVMGTRADCNGDGTGDHITGCAVYDPNIARLMPYLTTCDIHAWDYHYRDKIVQVGMHTNLIQNRYKQTNLEPGLIEEPGVVLIHGVKDQSAVKAVAQKYGISLS